MADVIDITSRFKKEPPSLAVVAAGAIEDIMGNWERFARNNRLKDFFLEMVPSYADENANYIGDLNALSLLEQKIRLQPGILSPGLNGPQQLGWRVCFKINSEFIETPDFISEAHARCCGILLYLKIKRELTNLGVPS